MISRRQLALLPAALASGAEPGGWKVALEFPGRLNAITISETGWPAAVGVRASKGVLLSGARWASSDTPETFVSIAARGAGQLLVAAGASGIWRSTDRGANWTLAQKTDGLLRVFLRDEYLGYAVGSEKTVLETADGGETWTPLDAAAQPGTAPEFTTYHWVDFVTPLVGVITGVSRPPRDGRTEAYPYWLDADRSSRRKEWPSASITLETRDGGRNWKNSLTSIFGRLNRVRYSRTGLGLTLLEFHDDFEYPSEVYALDLRKGSTDRVFRRKDRAVTDVLLQSGPRAWLASLEPPANPAEEARGLVRLFTSADLRDWQEMPLPVDVRAQRVWLAGNPAGQVLAACDSGVIFTHDGNFVESK
ncbi:MAG: hypothetical protein JNK87_32485 [Bryobacterales bacterium]|nr:hypothetical protein [Bryobacterales bacterium]